MALVPTPADIQYMKEHIRENKADEIIATNVVGLCIASVAVCLRFKSRRLLRTKIHTDDWMITVALASPRNPLKCHELLTYPQALYSGFAISYCIATHFGAGRHAISVTSPKALIEVNMHKH